MPCLGKLTDIGEQACAHRHMCTHMHAPCGVALLPHKREGQGMCVLIPSLALFRGLLILRGSRLVT